MKFKRLLAALISTVMIAGMFPAFVFADETEATPAETVETRITETKETEKKKPAESKETAPSKSEEKETEGTTAPQTPAETEKKETEEPKESAPEETVKEPEVSEEPSESEQPLESGKPSESGQQAGPEKDMPEESHGVEKTIEGKIPVQTDSIPRKNASYSANLRDCDLGTAVAGYDKLDYASSLYLSNTGSTGLNGAEDYMKIVLTGGNKTAFTLRYLSSGIMSAGGLFTRAYVYPAVGLSAGTYTATATLYYDEDGTGSSYGWVALDTATLTFKVKAPGTKHKVTVINGTATKTTASEGELIGLTPQPPAGKAFSKWEVTPGTVEFISRQKFIMPDTDVTFKAVFVNKSVSARLNDLDLGIAPVGYNTNDYYGRLIMDNTGTIYINGATGYLKVELTGGNTSAFTLKRNGSGTIYPEAHVLAAEVLPKAGLAKGTYKATATLYYDEDGSGSLHDWVALDSATIKLTVMDKATNLEVHSYTAYYNTEGALNIDEDEVSGSVRFSKTKATTGDIVDVYINPSTGYELLKIEWTNGVNGSKNDITSEREFQVIDEEPFVYVYFKKLKPDDPVKHEIHVYATGPYGKVGDTGICGTVTLNKYMAEKGEKITVTAIPSSGFDLFKIEWHDGQYGAGKDITSTKTFTVGDNDAYVYVLFWSDPVPNTLFSVKPRTTKVKYKKLRKKKQKVARSRVMTVSNVKGTLKYSLVKVKRGKSKKYKKYFKINSKTGTVSIKKKLRKGTYKITCKVSCSGNADYKSATKTVTFKIKVK